MRIHEAGALHAEGYGGPPLYLPYPDDVMALLPQLWAQTVRREAAGAWRWAGSTSSTWPASTAPRHT